MKAKIICVRVSPQRVQSTTTLVSNENRTNQVVEADIGNELHASEQKEMLTYVLQKASEIFAGSEILFQCAR